MVAKIATATATHNGTVTDVVKAPTLAHGQPLPVRQKASKRNAHKNLGLTRLPGASSIAGCADRKFRAWRSGRKDVLISLSGKSAVVTGGSKGIGRSIALELAKAGASVSICARGAAALEKTSAEITALGVRAHAATCDLGDKDAIASYIAAAGAALGGMDILVNNASGFGLGDDETGWTQSLNIDVMATVRASHAAIPLMERAGGGAILNISSISGFRGSARSAPYAAVKAALINYTMSQGLMLAPKRIRVNAIAPGSIEFPGGVWDERKTSNPQLYQSVLRSIPWGRLGHPEEIASAAVFLCSDAASWVTGQTLSVDGGQYLA
jgi:3-oxoacyl-[acyl-carrier protein] reductase